MLRWRGRNLENGSTEDLCTIYPPNKLPFNNDIYCIFFKSSAIVYYFVPAIELVTGVSVTAGGVFAAYSTATKNAEKEYIKPFIWN